MWKSRKSNTLRSQIGLQLWKIRMIMMVMAMLLLLMMMMMWTLRGFGKMYVIRLNAPSDTRGIQYFKVVSLPASGS